MATKLSLIVAVSENGVIGSQGELPWRLSEDLKRFKRLTMGHSIVMGRKTYESIGRPLPGRTSIVVTRQPDYNVAGIVVVSDIESAFAAAKADDEVFVIGGAEIYAQTIPIADRIYLTTVNAVVPGETKLPVLDRTLWKVTSSSTTPSDEKNDYPHTFEVLDRQ